MRALLKQLQESPDFQVVMDSMKQFRPVIPAYRPDSTTEADRALIEQIKYQSGRQDGFDLLFKFLVGK